MAATTETAPYSLLTPLSKQRLIWSIIAILSVFILQALGYTASAEELTSGGLVMAGVGTSN